MTEGRKRLGAPFLAAVRTPATWTFAGAWVVAATVLGLSGFGPLVLQAFGITVAVLVLCWVTALLTLPPPPVVRTATWRLRLQVAVLVALAAATGAGYAGMAGLGGRVLAHLPVWSGLVRAVTVPRHAFPIPAPFVILNPITDVGIPLAALLALGARPRELGLGPGHRVLRVMAVWAVLPLLGIALILILRVISPLTAVLVFIRDLFQNGFSEEFLWRGAIQTRLGRALGPAWGLVLASVGFGLWHLGANAPEVHGRILEAACAGIVSQASLGLGLGFVFQRTRNLVAGTVLHMLLDVAP